MTVSTVEELKVCTIYRTKQQYNENITDYGENMIGFNQMIVSDMVCWKKVKVPFICRPGTGRLWLHMTSA